MPVAARESDLELLRDAAHPLRGLDQDFDPLLEIVADSPCVLIGEASHGTHEFYHTRDKITKRLIVEKDFNAVAVEADWPDAYRVNRYVRGHSNDPDADRALGGFKRFPTWMWRNRVVIQFVEWLRQHNQDVREADAKTGFYGLDLYSLNASIEAVLAYLDRVDPQAARKPLGRRAAGMLVSRISGKTTRGMVTRQTSALLNPVRTRPLRSWLNCRNEQSSMRDGRIAEEDFFSAEQNARLIRNAEEYYRSMFRGVSPPGICVTDI